MPLNIEAKRILQERIDFHPTTIPRNQLLTKKAREHAVINRELRTIENHKTGTLYDLLEARGEKEGKHPVEIFSRFLSGRVCPDFIDTAKDHLEQGNISHFLFNVDMAAGMLELIKLIQMTEPQRRRPSRYRRYDYNVTRHLLSEDPTGRMLIREAADRIQGKFSLYPERPLPEDFIPEYMGIGAEVGVALFNRVYPMLRAITR